MMTMMMMMMITMMMIEMMKMVQLMIMILVTLKLLHQLLHALWHTQVALPLLIMHVARRTLLVTRHTSRVTRYSQLFIMQGRVAYTWPLPTVDGSVEVCMCVRARTCPRVSYILCRRQGSLCS